MPDQQSTQKSNSEQKPIEKRLRPKRSVGQAVSWWWQTRIKSLWTVKIPAHRAKRKLDAQANELKTRGASSGILAFKQRGTAMETPGMPSITAILTRYKRGEYLKAQVDALLSQSVPPNEIWVWCNECDEIIEDVTPLVDRVIVSNTNWKFWGRFSMATMARTQYVCLFDDDILPQPQWLEHCLEQYKQGTEGILGGSGVVLPVTGGYSSKHKVGWNGHHFDALTEVDLVGHAWFFKKGYLKYLWQEEPLSWENGEDIHFSYMALKHGGIKTWVPPHPESQPELWSCRPDFGKAVGRTNAATFKSTGHHSVRDDIVVAYREDGWQVVSQRQPKAE